MKNPHKNICIYCKASLNKENKSREHVFPKSLFKGLESYNPIVVPACSSCNAEFKKDDEYFRTFISIPNRMSNQSGKSLFHNVVRPGLRHPKAKKFQQKILSNIGKILIPDKSGYGYQVDFDKDRIDKILHKIIRGLYYYHYNILLDNENPFKQFDGFYYVERNNFFNSNEGNYLLTHTTKYELSKNNVFYRHSLINNDQNHSIWYLWFFGSIDFFIEVKI